MGSDDDACSRVDSSNELVMGEKQPCFLRNERAHETCLQHGFIFFLVSLPGIVCVKALDGIVCIRRTNRVLRPCAVSSQIISK